MTCDSYGDARLAAVYDALNPPGADTDFYLDLAGDTPLAILDMGCGTGWLATDLARRGHRVIGADPAGAMLDIARARPGGERVNWVQSDAAHLDLAIRFDLIVMTGHVFQVFLDDATTLTSLQSLRRHLKPGGRLAFETRNPAVREWQDWTASQTQTEVVVSGKCVSVHYDVVDVAESIVTYETHFAFGPTDRNVSIGRVRFIDAARLGQLLIGAGFAELTWFGDWDRSALGAGSPEIIVVAGQARGRPQCRPALRRQAAKAG
ncbi:MAG: class I SAM-dependent methyltransferase [Ferrovibrionaceae bacterium]